MSALTIISIVFIVYVLFAVYRKEKRKKADERLNFMHANLQKIINDWPVSKVNELKINSYFDDIKKVRWGDAEKVSVLHKEFEKKFKEEEDEFSPESVFRK